MHALKHVKPFPPAPLSVLRAVADAQNDSVHDDAVPMNDLERRVIDGLRAGEFHLVYQGAYRAASGALARLEAQVRWSHPDYGLLLPGVFMMPLEHPEVAHEMASFVVESVCRELSECLAAKRPVQTVAFSVPAQIAVLESFAENLARVARAYGVPTNLIEVDVADSAEAAKLLSMHTLTSDLREAGVGISLGKWGSGASSLALLASLDVDTITIARELMAAVPRDARACTVLSALLNLLQTLDVRVLASGVDTPEQLNWLAQWPDVLAQGAALARPQAGLANALNE